MENRKLIYEGLNLEHELKGAKRSADKPEKKTGEKFWQWLLEGLGSLACDEYSGSAYWMYYYDMYL